MDAIIFVPKLSHIPFETPLMGAIGYVAGRLANVNPKLSAVVLAVSSLANHFLFQVTNHQVRPFLKKFTKPYFKLSAEATYTATHAIVSTVTVLAACHFDLISRHMAGVLLFISTIILVTRLSSLSQNKF